MIRSLLFLDGAETANVYPSPLPSPRPTLMAPPSPDVAPAAREGSLLRRTRSTKVCCPLITSTTTKKRNHRLDWSTSQHSFLWTNRCFFFLFRDVSFKRSSFGSCVVRFSLASDRGRSSFFAEWLGIGSVLFMDR